MRQFPFGKYDIELIDDPCFSQGSSDNVYHYDFVYLDKPESRMNRLIQHGIRVCHDGQVLKSAVICASGGATGIYENSYLIDDNNLIICCANSLFSLSLPDLKLNWVREADMITCFAVHKIQDGFFTHGEMEVSRINSKGEVLWHKGFMDILVNIESTESCFILNQDNIQLLDFSKNRYRLDFDGNFIAE